MPTDSPIPRPAKKRAYTLPFASRQAEKGWRDLQANRMHALAEAWDYLTDTPLAASPLTYRLKAQLSTVERNGLLHDRWQRKLNARDGARIWYYVEGNRVMIEQVFTTHPNQTK
jgi:hypothetical protein